MKKSLRDLLAERALRVAKPGESFTLSTGRQSNFYFNCKPVTLSSEGASLVADAFLDKLKLFPEPVGAVGGLTLGADPIVIAMIMRGPERGIKLEGFYVRDKKKSHGTKELIANVPPAGTNVVIVDDVVTTGQSTIDAIEAVKAADCNVVGVIVLMDRREQDGEANIRKHVRHYFSVYTRDDFPEIDQVCDTKQSERRSKISA
jgi:orotate phosphoribosyltransferase